MSKRAVMIIANGLIRRRHYPRSKAVREAWSIVKSIKVVVDY